MKQQDSKKIVVRLLPSVDAEPLYRGQIPGSTVDCRLLLLGDRYRQLLRTYTEVVYRMSRPGDLKTVAAEVLESAEIQQYYDVSLANGYVGLTLRDGIFQEQYPLHSDDFMLRITAGSQVMTVPLPLERFRALGTLLPLLAGDKGDSEIALGLEETLDPDEQEWSRDLLAKLDAQGFLQRGPMRSNSFLISPVRPRVTFVGHTSILLQTAGAMVLTDPLLRNVLRSPGRAFDITRLELTAICCTHSHWDHCDVETLLRFDKRIPIIIPRVHQATAFNPPIAPVLRRLGFRDIRELDPWQSQKLGDVELILIPFHGEQDEPGAVIDHYTYVFRTRDLTLYGGVDAYRDTFADMNSVLARVRNEYRPSVAFLPISRMVYRYEHGGVNGFCRYIDTTLLGQDFQYTAGPEEAAEWVRLLGVSTVVPYATFTFSPYATPHELNRFADALKQNGLEPTLLPLRPLDSLEVSDLNGSVRAARRRRLLRAWHRSAGRATLLDQRLRQYALYRFGWRLLAGAAPSTASHHH
jgi:L-ascorbate metabolism protein UlaG (beta-lactamase superfamily)